MKKALAMLGVLVVWLWSECSKELQEIQSREGS